MRCRCCHDAAGWLRRECADCARLRHIFDQVCGAPMPDVYEALFTCGVERRKIESFLASDLEGQGTVRDRIAAAAANQLFESFGGTAGKQTAAEVRRLRERGGWVHLDKPPEDGCG